MLNSLINFSFSSSGTKGEEGIFERKSNVLSRDIDRRQINFLASPSLVSDASRSTNVERSRRFILGIGDVDN